MAAAHLTDKKRIECCSNVQVGTQRPQSYFWTVCGSAAIIRRTPGRGLHQQLPSLGLALPMSGPRAPASWPMKPRLSMQLGGSDEMCCQLAAPEQNRQRPCELMASIGFHCSMHDLGQSSLWSYCKRARLNVQSLMVSQATIFVQMAVSTSLRPGCLGLFRSC